MSDTLQTSARPRTLAEILGVEEKSLTVSLDRAEAAGWISVADGRVTASRLLSIQARSAIGAITATLDAAAGAKVALESWHQTHGASDFFCSIKLMIDARQESQAIAVLNENAGTLLTTCTSNEAEHELSCLLQQAATNELKGILESTKTQISAGRDFRVPSTSSENKNHHPVSLEPFTSLAVRVQHTYASESVITEATANALASGRSDSQRLADATIALVAAANSGKTEKIEAAYSLIQFLGGTTPESLPGRTEAKVIYSTSTGKKSDAISSAHELAAIARSRTNIPLACRAFRIAAQAFATYGLYSTAAELVRESYRIAESLHYPAQTIAADLCLADLAIDTMQLNAARAHLKSAAAEIAAHGLKFRIALVDLQYFSSWEAVVVGAEQRALFHAHRYAKELGKPRHTTAQLCKYTLQLATHSGPPTAELNQAAKLLIDSIGNPAHATSEQRHLCAVILYALQADPKTDVIKKTLAALDRIRSSGQPVWGFLSTVAARFERR